MPPPDAKKFRIPRGGDGRLTRNAPTSPATAPGDRCRFYGHRAWTRLNAELSAYSLLPKFVLDRPGFRIATGPNAGREMRSWVDIATKATQLTFDAPPADLRDSDFKSCGEVTVHEWRLFMGDLFCGLISCELLSGAEKSARRPRGGGIESLDRVISSRGEAALAGSGSGIYNPGGALERNRSSACDSVVQSPSGTLGIKGPLQKSTFLDTMDKSLKAGGMSDAVLMFGSRAVHSKIQEIFDPSKNGTGVPEIGEALMEIGPNGARAATGRGVPIHMTTVYGVPFFPINDPGNCGPEDGGRIFGIDSAYGAGSGKPAIGIGAMALPTYSEVIRDAAAPYDGGPIARGMYWTVHQLRCSRFGGQFKIRDIEI